MKFSIRFADQIVGVLIILALSALVFVIFMLGSSQRWFSRDYHFKTYFNSASGLSQNMPIQYKGFTIGHVKSFDLSEDDRVEVRFTIFDTYVDRVKHGSLVEILVSPIGLGNQFMFYSGAGPDVVAEGETIPAVNSSEGKRLLASGQALLPERNDSINNMMNQANTLLATLNGVLTDVDEAFKGTSQTTVGRTLGNVELAAAGLELMSRKLPDDLDLMVTGIMSQLQPILSDLNELSKSLADPNGTVMAILDSDGEVYTDLVISLNAISGALQNIKQVSDFIPPQLPQLAALLFDLQSALESAEDVLVALTNNPLLKGGVPERKESPTGGARPRDLEF
ncbi:MAG: MlaD family protein [Treponema sp.]|jgi:phospholipid/cholesterol/gamma-HCH transport system substrate-binding protein|nr:MlaD family protein [Treponema sp.]